MIVTERLILRELEERDLDHLVAAINNIDIVKNTARIPFPYTRADAEDYLKLTRTAEPGALRLSVVLREAPGVVMGGAGYEGGSEDLELGYWLAEPHWGKGLGTEAAEAVTRFAFANTTYSKMVAGYRLGNEASRRILANLGFVPTHQVMVMSRGLGHEVPVQRMELTRAAWRNREDRAR
jgi:RimJ/RimL family protein N-acetyltransferase